MLAKASLMHGDIGYKFCWLLPQSRSTSWTWISWDTNWERINWWVMFHWWLLHFLFLFCGNMISWVSKKKKRVVACSSTEFEYKALASSSSKHRLVTILITWFEHITTTKCSCLVWQSWSSNSCWRSYVSFLNETYRDWCTLHMGEGGSERVWIEVCTHCRSNCWCAHKID